MKRRGIILGCTLAAVLVLSVGCASKKTLICTQTASGVNIEFNIGFNGDKVNSMKLNYDMDLSSFTDTQIEAIGKQDFCSTIKSSMSDYSDAFENCEQNIESKKLIVKSDLDVDKIAKDEKDKLGSIDDAKKGLEDEGYSCTIK